VSDGYKRERGRGRRGRDWVLYSRVKAARGRHVRFGGRVPVCGFGGLCIGRPISPSAKASPPRRAASPVLNFSRKRLLE
jgi:hypothetical protein